MRKGRKYTFLQIDAEVAVLSRGQAVSTGVKGSLKRLHYRYYMTRAEFSRQFVPLHWSEAYH